MSTTRRSATLVGLYLAGCAGAHRDAPPISRAPECQEVLVVNVVSTVPLPDELELDEVRDSYCDNLACCNPPDPQQFGGPEWTAYFSVRDLFGPATRAAEAGNHHEALDRAQRAAQIQTTLGLILFMAREELTVGLAGDAYRDASRCESVARRDTATPMCQRVFDACRDLKRRARLQIGAVRLRQTLPSIPGLTVEAGDAAFRLAVDVAHAVTPGIIRVDVRADGTPRVDDNVSVAQGQIVEIAVGTHRPPTCDVLPSRPTR